MDQTQCYRFLKIIYTHIFGGVLGLWGCAWAFSSCRQLGLLFVAVQASPCGGFCCHKARTLKHRTLKHRACALWHMGLVALWHVESSWNRNQSCVPCSGRQPLSHWTTSKVQTQCYICKPDALIFSTFPSNPSVE